jgi:LGFP repeat
MGGRDRPFTTLRPSDIEVIARQGPKVVGAIRARWLELGGANSYLRNPVTDEMDYSEGGRVSVFQGGAIYWWPDVGAIDIGEMFVRYQGLNCFSTTSGPGSDEPYVTMAITVPGIQPLSFRSRIYEDVDGGDTRPDQIELYRGQPRGMTIVAQLIEHDNGNPENYRGVMTAVAAAAGTGITALVTLVPAIGPVLGAAAGPILAKLSPAIGDELGQLFGLGDDVIGNPAIFAFSPRDMVLLAARTENSNERQVQFKIASPLLVGDEGNYKVYFGMSKAP